MANNLYWFQTTMPLELVELVESTLQPHDSSFSTSRTTSGVHLEIRDSKTLWVNEKNWIVGLCWHYVMLANKENFLYDIDGFEGGTMQYTSYEPGEYYNWHVDGDIANCRQPTLENKTDEFIQSNLEKCRKLSIILQLSDPNDYTGGEVQIQFSDRATSFIPKHRGTLAVFDSRCLHRVKPVRSGHRKSLVGWIEGPRWK